MATIMSLTAAIGKLLPWLIVAVCPSEPVPMVRHTYVRIPIATLSLSTNLSGTSEARVCHPRTNKGGAMAMGMVCTPNPEGGRYGV